MVENLENVVVQEESEIELKKKEIDRKVGEKVKILCVVENTTRKKLAEVMGISETSMINKCGGKTPFTMSELVLISEFFGKNIDELLK